MNVLLEAEEEEEEGGPFSVAVGSGIQQPAIAIVISRAFNIRRGGIWPRQEGRKEGRKGVLCSLMLCLPLSFPPSLTLTLSPPSSKPNALKVAAAFPLSLPPSPVARPGRSTRSLRGCERSQQPYAARNWWGMDQLDGGGTGPRSCTPRPRQARENSNSLAPSSSSSSILPSHDHACECERASVV